MIARRTFLAASAAAGMTGLLAPRAFADAPAAATPAAEGPRSYGSPNAKFVVQEFFSLTCTHCAHFSMTTMPQVEEKLIKPGLLRMEYHDFPLDAVALEAAMIARHLPAEQYYPFCSALFASQDRWAFAQGVNYTDELWKMAALAGMSRATFDAAIKDQALKTWILKTQSDDAKKYNIDATPSFLINGHIQAGDMEYDDFAKAIGATA